MKKIIAGFLFLFSCSVFAQSSEKVINQVYGTISSTCLQNSNIDASTQTAVNGDSASGQKTVNVTATTNIAAGDYTVIGKGSAREELCSVASVGAGPTMVCVSNLTYTHTSAQGDKVDKTNRLSLTADKRYLVYCHDGAGAGVACNCFQGTATVDPVYTATLNVVYPLTLVANEKIILRASSAASYLSCYAFASDKYLNACPLNTAP